MTLRLSPLSHQNTLKNLFVFLVPVRCRRLRPGHEGVSRDTHQGPHGQTTGGLHFAPRPTRSRRSRGLGL